MWFKVLFFGIVPVYGSARGVLLILVFLAFLEVPSEVYDQINWTSLVPTIG